ncbi:hypothetical protein N0V82_004298 [Gnomoniopsis sp. IMI 355080]|nr:hypothetical protein N0V82_004298 [Gnomoniopsis sp. IMI 355080]
MQSYVPGPILWASALVAAWITYYILQALYNISPLHPLHKIPGPRLAAATYLPEFYHDIILGGRYTHAIKAMHDKYGPIVRINPWEIHCSDIAFADEIFALGGRKRDKPMHHINGSGVGITNTFGAKEHDLHKTRRAPLAKMFSTGMIAQLEDEIHGFVTRLCDQLLAESGKGPIDVTTAYSCFTSDVIFTYCFGESNGFLQQDGWYPNFREPTLAMIKYTLVFKFFPLLVKLQGVAVWFLDYLPKDIAFVVRSLKVTIPQRAFDTKAKLDAGIHFDRPTIFETLLKSDLEDHEKRPERLADEAITVTAAGTETTSWTLAVITFHLLDKPHLLDRLVAELRANIDDPKNLPRWTILEKLPYLSAVIQEGLRLSYGVSGPIALEAPEEDLVYRGEFQKKPVELVIPRGSAMAMSNFINHHNEDMFPDSHAFIPERWLDEDGGRNKALEKGTMSFSRGPRACMGKNLALCELHLVLAALALRVLPNMALYETTEKDVVYDFDMTVPMPAAGSKGVRVTIE